MSNPAPSEELARIIESARRLGVLRTMNLFALEFAVKLQTSRTQALCRQANSR